MINLKRFAVHTLLLVALIALIYVPSFALISFTGKATVIENFSDTARIGSVPVSGLTRKEAKPKVQEAVTSWSKKTPLTVGTGEETLPIPTELVTFKIEESIKQASLKKGGALQVTVDETAMEAYLASQPITYTEEQVKTFNAWLMKTSKRLEEGNFDPSETAAAIDPAGEVVSSVTFTTRSAAEEQMIDAMAQVDIKAGQLMNVKTYGMDPMAASFIGSKLYELFAKTPLRSSNRCRMHSYRMISRLVMTSKLMKEQGFAVATHKLSIIRSSRRRMEAMSRWNYTGHHFKESSRPSLKQKKRFRTGQSQGIRQHCLPEPAVIHSPESKGNQSNCIV